ncbi:MAG: nucleotide exchange factor GrpE [Nitrospirae bacterium]|nr:nucleotide exchange factor GrpE [Nitrospirota bacterium]
MEDSTQTTEIDETAAATETQQETCDTLRAERDEYKDKHLRLYAEFENYRRKALKDKDEVLKYANESIVYELLPVMDSLDMALQHSSTGNSEALSALAKGVENTLREMNRTLEKFGLTQIEAAGKAFDPSVHHAMSQVERNDMDENMVVQELRKGYMYKEKVLRATLVTVSKRTSENNSE